MATLQISPVIVPLPVSVPRFDNDCNLFEYESQLPLDSNFQIKSVSEIQELFTTYLKSCNNEHYYAEHTPIETKAIFLNNLIQTGNLGLISHFCDLFDPSILYQIVNAKPRDMYFGNVLHTTLYSNKGESARQLYTYFRFVGAIPSINYYNEKPWRQTGTSWTCIPNKVYKRDLNEFTDIYQWARDFEIEKDYNFGQIMDSCSAHKRSKSKSGAKTSTPFLTPCPCEYHHSLDLDSGSDSDSDSD